MFNDYIKKRKQKLNKLSHEEIKSLKKSGMKIIISWIIAIGLIIWGMNILDLSNFDIAIVTTVLLVLFAIVRIFVASLYWESKRRKTS